MKKIFYIAVAALVLFATNSCKDKKTTPVISANDSLEVEEDMADTTIYGVCGEGTTMHELQLITDTGDTINAFIDDTEPNIVKGGLLSGDRIALIASEGDDGEMVAQQIINLTSLLGKWTSLDKTSKSSRVEKLRTTSRLSRILGHLGKFSMANFCSIRILSR